MADPKPFLVRHRDGREFELANDDAGKRAYRETYMRQGFAVVKDAPEVYGIPEFYEEDAAPDPVELTKLTRAELDAKAADIGIADADKLPNKDAVIAAIEDAPPFPSNGED